MSRNRYVSVNDFTGAVTSIVREWVAESTDSASTAVVEVAEDARDQLKVEGGFSNRTGKYRKGWRITFEEKRYGLKAVVHNTLYQLTHLLESGHAKFLWGRPTGDYVQAFPHIEKVNQEAQEELEREIKRRLQ